MATKVELAFSSQASYMHLLRVFRLPLTTASGVTGQVVAEHNLGYVPYYQVWADIDGFLINCSAENSLLTPIDLFLVTVTIRATENNITITQSQTNGNNQTIVYFVRIYEDFFT